MSEVLTCMRDHLQRANVPSAPRDRRTRIGRHGWTHSEDSRPHHEETGEDEDETSFSQVDAKEDSVGNVDAHLLPARVCRCTHGKLSEPAHQCDDSLGRKHRSPSSPLPPVGPVTRGGGQHSGSGSDRAPHGHLQCHQCCAHDRALSTTQRSLVSARDPEKPLSPGLVRECASRTHLDRAFAGTHDLQTV